MGTMPKVRRLNMDGTGKAAAPKNKPDTDVEGAMVSPLVSESVVPKDLVHDALNNSRFEPIG